MKSLTSHSASCHFHVIAFIPRTCQNPAILDRVSRSTFTETFKKWRTPKGEHGLRTERHIPSSTDTRAHFSITRSQDKARHNRHNRHNRNTRPTRVNIRTNPEKLTVLTHRTRQNQLSQRRVSTSPPSSVTLLFLLSSLPNCFLQAT